MLTPGIVWDVGMQCRSGNKPHSWRATSTRSLSCLHATRRMMSQLDALTPRLTARQRCGTVNEKDRPH